MANAADHVAAILPEPFTVLGQKLKPLTLGHCFWLERLECKTVESINDLICAVLICSSDWDKFDRSISGLLFPVKMRTWQWRLSWRWRKDKSGPFKAINLFNEYIAEACEPPDVFQKDSGSGSIGTPWLYHLKTVLQAKLGYSRDEAMALSMREAILDYYSQAEINGSIELVSEDDRSMHKIALANHDRLQELGRKTFPNLN